MDVKVANVCAFCVIIDMSIDFSYLGEGETSNVFKTIEVVYQYACKRYFS